MLNSFSVCVASFLCSSGKEESAWKVTVMFIHRRDRDFIPVVLMMTHFTGTYLPCPSIFSSTSPLWPCPNPLLTWSPSCPLELDSVHGSSILSTQIDLTYFKANFKMYCQCCNMCGLWCSNSKLRNYLSSYSDSPTRK